MSFITLRQLHRTGLTACLLNNVMKEEKPLYHLIDSRAGIALMEVQGNNLNDLIEDWEKYILFSSTNPNEICSHANKGDYGNLCVVAKDNIIMWEWNGEKEWSVKII